MLMASTIATWGSSETRSSQQSLGTPRDSTGNAAIRFLIDQAV